MPDFTPLDHTLYTLAALTLTQLYREGSYSRSAATSLDSDPARGFDIGEGVTIRRPKIRGAAQDLNPRSAAATPVEQEYVEVNLRLDHCWADAFPDYVIDARSEQVMLDATMAAATNIGISFEAMFYAECFRDYSGVPASGAVQYANGAPLQIVFAESASGVLGSFAPDHLARASAVLNFANVPATDRFAFASAFSAGDWAVAQPTAEGQSGAMAMGGQLLMSGMSQGMFVPRSGFSFGVSNSITGQVGIADLGDGPSIEPVAAFTQDTTVFFDGDVASGTTPLGAVQVTIDMTADPTSVAVGQIARLGPDAGPAKAYGVILRVDAGDKYVWLVPYNAKGQKLTAAQLVVGTDNFSVPSIPYLNTAHHREFLIFGSRPFKQPAPGSGGVVASQALPQYGVVVNATVGAYNALGLKQDRLIGVLTGCRSSDHRKAAFMLSA